MMSGRWGLGCRVLLRRNAVREHDDVDAPEGEIRDRIRVDLGDEFPFDLVLGDRRAAGRDSFRTRDASNEPVCIEGAYSARRR
jgi:hypothetical protein